MHKAITRSHTRAWPTPHTNSPQTDRGVLGPTQSLVQPGLCSLLVDARHRKKLSLLRRPADFSGAEKSRPINCDLRDDEVYLFHGTQPNAVDDIAKSGLRFRRGDCDPYVRRYGEGNYFTDESCKAQQYAGTVEKEDGSIIHTLLYCRVAMGTALKFEVTNHDAGAGYLQGVQAPTPDDPVFRRKMQARGSADQACERWDSVIAQAATGEDRASQIHREVVTFDTWQNYPEYVVQVQ